MIQPPETISTISRRVCCDGSAGIVSRAAPPSALGHPRVWLEIDERGYIDCGYCDRRFVLEMAGRDDDATMGHAEGL